jgi:hypothetical protein
MACPDPEFLAAMVEDRLDPQERQDLLDHASRCDACRETLLVLQSEQPAVARPRTTQRIRRARPSGAPWAVAAALALSVAGFFLIGERTRRRRSFARLAGSRKRRQPDAPPPAPPSRLAAAPTPVVPPPAAPRVEAPLVVEKRNPVAPEAPAPAPAPTVENAAPRVPAPATVAVAATLDGVEGEVFVLGPGDPVRAAAGRVIHARDGLVCSGARSSALLAFADRTRLELGPDTVVREIVEREGTKGRRLFVEKGLIKADVAKQPGGVPMIVETPHGEARILGTTFALHVDSDPKKGTRLEVEEGRVELKNGAGKSVTVDAGHQAVAAAGAPMSVRTLPKEELIFGFTFEDAKRPALVATGTVERGPGSRICLVGDADVGGTSHIGISDAERGLFVVRGDEVLSFDYWVDSQAASVNFNFWNRNQRRDHWAEVPKLVTGKWSHASFRLAELGMKEGDWIGNLILQATGSPGRRFYLDNLAITRSRVLKPRAVEAKK